MLLAAITVGCSSSDQLSEEYRKGYADGQQAEQDQWPDKYLQLANKIVADQIESQSSIQSLVQGKISDLKIDHIEKKGLDRTLIWMAAEHKGKSFISGYFEFQKIDNKWFLITTRKTLMKIPLAEPKN